jgi:hypothetical protein
MPDYSQNFNRYSYALNNPLVYTDPSGEWLLIDDLIAAAIGGVVNLTVNIIQGNIQGDFWQCLGQGAAAFGAGAAAGDLALYGPAGWAAGGAIVGGTNAWLGGATTFGDIVMGAGTGAFSGLAGGAVGTWAASSISPLLNGIGSPVLKGAISGVVGGAAGGYTGGFTGGLLLTGDFSSAHQSGMSGMWMGAGIGAAAGAGYGFKYAKAKDLNPWTGEKLNSLLPLKPKPANQIRTDPKNLVEQLALKEAKSGQGKKIMQGKINDPKYQNGWQKISHTHKLPDGMGYVEIHYWKNMITGEMKGFKFK